MGQMVGVAAAAVDGDEPFLLQDTTALAAAPKVNVQVRVQPEQGAKRLKTQNQFHTYIYRMQSNLMLSGHQWAEIQMETLCPPCTAHN